MSRKWLVFAGVALAALIALPLGWYLLSPLVISRTVDEAFPPVAAAGIGEGASGAVSAVRVGKFHAVVHEGAGQATIVRQAGGVYVLRLEDFTVLNGPDLYVYLSALPDSTTSAPVLSHDYLSVAPLKGSKGNQTYTLPADFDPVRFNSVVIWCQQFRVNFATAPLQ